MVTEYTDPNSVRCAITGFILELCNHIRLKADVQHSSDYLWSFISQMAAWLSFQPILRQQTLLQVHNIAKPKPGSVFSFLFPYQIFNSFPVFSFFINLPTTTFCCRVIRLLRSLLLSLPFQPSPKGSESTSDPTTRAEWDSCRAVLSQRSPTRHPTKKRRKSDRERG